MFSANDFWLKVVPLDSDPNFAGYAGLSGQFCIVIGSLSSITLRIRRDRLP